MQDIRLKEKSHFLLTMGEAYKALSNLPMVEGYEGVIKSVMESIEYHGQHIDDIEEKLIEQEEINAETENQLKDVVYENWELTRYIAKNNKLPWE